MNAYETKIKDILSEFKIDLSHSSITAIAGMVRKAVLSELQSKGGKTVTQKKRDHLKKISQEYHNSIQNKEIKK